MAKPKGVSSLTQAEIDDLILILEKHVNNGLDGLIDYFDLMEGQDEDMMANLQSAVRKLRD